MSTHPRVGTLHHTGEESSLVLQIPHAQALQSRDTLACNTAITSPASVLPHHLGVDSRKTELGHVGNDDERAGESALVTCLCALDDLGSENDV